MSEIAHNERAHARLSASGANRWINCPASVRIEELFPDESSEAALEGTLAHELAELEQRKYLGLIDSFEYNSKLADIRDNVLYNPSMHEYVDEYVEYVLGHYFRAQSENLSPMILIETRLDLTKYIPEGFGTLDDGLLIGDTLHVIDLKFGYIRVDAVENKQLMIYGIGLVEHFKKQNIFAKKNFEKKVKNVVLHIVQPRIKNYSTYELTVNELQKWADTDLVGYAKTAYSGEGKQKAGVHCQYCNGAHSCKVLAEKATSEIVEAVENDSDLELLTPDDKAKLYLNLPVYSLWVSAFETHMTNAAAAGARFKGLKIVEGTTRRVISDPKAVVKTLIEAGVDRELLYDEKLIPLGKLEKLLGKKDTPKYIGKYIFKPRGAMILAAESDKRPNYDLGTPESDFAEPIED